MAENTKIKVVLNTCYGGFGVSKELSGNDLEEEDAKSRELGYDSNFGTTLRYNDHRRDPIFIKAIMSLGKESFGRCANLTIYEIPIEFKDCFEIDEYDGGESLNLSSELLVAHKLKGIDVKNMEPITCQEFLLKLQTILATDYMEQVTVINI